MPGIRLILALHNHQPVGNFDGVFESAFRDSYRPFLEVLEGYPEIPFVLHTSGPLMEWLAERQPGYIARLRSLVEAGRVEILGGPFYEPILAMIPHRDRMGQIRAYSDYLHDLFGQRVRGVWIPERVWEPHFAAALAEAGIEYTVLDDFHFLRAGLDAEALHGYYLTEEEGRLLKVFPGSERLRYLVPFQEPHASYEFLKEVADKHPGATVVFADDGEKFGAWPRTFDHVYTQGWLRRFCDMIVGNRSWIQPTTFACAVEETLPLGKIYLPDSSYREMTEWALPSAVLARYEGAVRTAKTVPEAADLLPFARAGGFWRNFKMKYPETDEMYARALEVSGRIAEAALVATDSRALDVARRELYRGQCNCPYWHGAFGGLYLPHLRHAIYHHLIAAENALDTALGISGPRVALEIADFNLDARQEVRIANDRMVAYARPAVGGHLYELDLRRSLVNVLATLDRRPEPYHAAIASGENGPAGVHDHVVLMQEGLDRLLVYDRTPRKAFVDHFYPLNATLDDLATGKELERGDFALGTYLASVDREPGRVRLVMERPGLADGAAIQVRKEFSLAAGSDTLEVTYTLEDVPHDAGLHFAVEINLAGMAGHADDRYYTDESGTRLGMLDSRVDLEASSGVRLTDEWLDLAVGLEWSQVGGLWSFPIETVSQSEAGFEGVYQSSAVIPHWVVTPDEEGRWEVTIRLSIQTARAASRATSAAELSTVG